MSARARRLTCRPIATATTRAALAAATATTAVGAWSYVSTRSELEGAVDRSLDAAAHTTNLVNLVRQGGNRPGQRPRSFDQILGQLIANDGSPLCCEEGESVDAYFPPNAIRVLTS